MALLHVHFFSQVLKLNMNMQVILPQRAGNPACADPGKKYPTLYLLHGMYGDSSVWERRTSIERYADEKGIAVVMPEVHLSFYADTHYGMNYWKFISEELPVICRDLFPGMSDRREDTYVAGLSMGGYGAMKLAFAASDTFSWAASLSGAFDLPDITAQLPGSEFYFDQLFTSLDAYKGSVNDLFSQAEKLAASGKPLPKLYFWCGTDDDLHPHTIKMRDRCKQLGYDVTFEESPGGHEWCCWDAKIRDVLRWLPDR